MSGKHGKLSPSKAHRWLVCPGSQHFDSDSPESSYAEDGQLGHTILQLMMQGMIVLNGDSIRVGEKIFPAPEARIQQAVEIRDFIKQWREQHPDFVVETETPVKVAASLGFPKRSDDMDGTADLAGYSIEKRELVILDAKFGFVRVEPKGNPQLYLYASGVLNELMGMFPDLKTRDWSVTVIIAQPDYEGVVQFREHRMKFDEMAGWLSDNIPKIRAAVEGSNKLDASSEHACRYCPARNTCGPRQEVLLKFAQDDWRMTQTLGELLPLLPQIRRIADDLEAEAKKQLAEGMTVPGYKLVESRSIRKWSPTLDRAQVEIAATQRGIQLVESKWLSPAQVEKKHKALGKLFTKDFAIVPQGAPKLAPDSDPRPAYKPENFTQEEIDSMLDEE